MIGLDLGDRSSSYCVLDETGEKIQLSNQWPYPVVCNAV